MENSPLIVDSRINIMKMIILPKILQIQCNSNKNTNTFFIDPKSAILNLIWKKKKKRKTRIEKHTWTLQKIFLNNQPKLK